MPTFSNSPILPERRDTAVLPDAAKASDEVEAQAVPASPDTESGAAPTAEPVPLEESAPLAEEASSAPAAEDASVRAEAVPPAAPSRPAIRASRDDNVLLRNFGKAQPASLERLNADFGLKLNEGRFLRLRDLFAHTLRRDPTAGELRLLDALDRARSGDPSREAVGELYTDSPLIAETWADMMAKHASLRAPRGFARAAGNVPMLPCTFEGALSLVSRYLNRTGMCLPVTDGGKNAQGRIAVLSAPWQEAEALAMGYTPCFRAAVGDGSRSVWIRRYGALPVIPEKPGDFLLCLRRAAPHTVAALIDGERQKTRPALGEIRAVAGRGVLGTVLSLCTGAELYPHRLLRVERSTPGGRIEADALCARPTVSLDGASDYILRVPLKRMKEMTAALQALSADAIVIGQVHSGDKTVIRMRNRMGTGDVIAAELPSALLRGYPRTGLHRRRAEARDGESPDGLSVYSPAVARYTSPHAPESGLAPNGNETVALTRLEGQVAPVPEAGLLLSSFAVTVTEAGRGYHAAMETASRAVGSLVNAGISPADVRLAISVVSRDGVYAPGDLTVEVLCGLYRFTASNSIPAEDPAMTVTPPSDVETPSVSVTVTAWARHRELCERLTAETQALRYAESAPVSKEAPSFTLPVLRRSCEPSLRALAALLKSSGKAAAVMQPIAMKTVETEVAAEDTVPAEDTPEAPRTVKELRRVPDPDSTARLAERLGQWTLPVFAMSEEDARILLSEPVILTALEHRSEMGYPTVALNGACSAFAEKGLLPAALSAIESLPSEGQEVVAVCASTGKTVTRMSRADLLIPAEASDAPALVTLTLPDGRTVSDGFTGRDGKVLGLLNGLDDASVSLLFRHTFENDL